MASHIICVQHLINQHQPSNDLTNGGLLRSIDDTRMGHPCNMHLQKIVVLCEYDPTLRMRSLQMLSVRST